MLFNSFGFLFLFLPLALVGFYWLHRKASPAAAHTFLAAASLVFYALWDVRMLPILLLSLFVNHLFVQAILARRTRVRLVAGLLFNLALLGFFKYAGFAVDNLNAIGAGLPRPDIALPLGISFFTFQAIAYLVDAWRGEITRHDAVSWTLFITWFPQLIAGPIVHHREVMPQFARARLASAEQVGQGLFLLCAGLFKKVVIADQLAPIADAVFANAASATFFEAWVGVLSYSLQIYFDFAGYSEMAMGIALLFGIELPKNFDSPYKARSIQEFWRTWHMTLSRWIRDYLYVPLGGSRHGAARTVAALVVTMSLAGLWHGAAWTFLLWGLLHGAFLVTNRLWSKTGWRLPFGLAHSLTLLAVVFAWVVFRAPSVSAAIELWSAMLGVNGIVLPTGFAAVFGALPGVQYAHSAIVSGLELFAVVLLIILVLHAPNVHELRTRLVPDWRWGSAVGISALAGVASLGNPTVFLYWSW